eukprot:scaffold102206_cov38-Cyclotella_meneghiniana.AAC.1
MDIIFGVEFFAANRKCILGGVLVDDHAALRELVEKPVDCGQRVEAASVALVIKKAADSGNEPAVSTRQTHGR